jgi:two-component system, chemotaxis family, protein-glutamate methylesterase/glutaminase
MERGAVGVHRDLVVIGASAGGVEPLKRVVAGLPYDLCATVCIVLHVAPGSPSALAGILGRAGTLPCRPASDGERLVPGEVLVAPPDRHLAVVDGQLRLTIGPRENNHRPSVDVLFRSAALALGQRVIGVVLSGMRDDGTAGLAAIKSRGGKAIVQDPAEAIYPAMPSSALEQVPVDAVVTSGEIARTIAEMVNGNDAPPTTSPEVSGSPLRQEWPENVLTCPECGGILSERADAGMNQWQCRLGHRYSVQTLADAQAEGVEAALWTAIRALTDRARLLRQMADQAQSRGQQRTVRSFRRRAELADAQAELVHGALTQAAQAALRSIAQDHGEGGEAEGDAA